MKKDTKKRVMTDCAKKSKRTMSAHDSIAHEKLQKKIAQIKVVNCVIESICT